MKTSKLIAKLLLAVLLIGYATSCHEDEDDFILPGGSQSGKLIKQIELDDGGYYPQIYTFTYDGNKLKTAQRSEANGIMEKYEYDYFKDVLIIKNYYGTDTCFLNKHGFYGSIQQRNTAIYGQYYSDLDYYYDKNGYLIKYIFTSTSIDSSNEESFINSKWVFNYSNGNRVQDEYLHHDSGMGYRSNAQNKYIYTDLENKSAIDILSISHLYNYAGIADQVGGFIGRPSKNLVEKVETISNVSYNNDITSRTSITYLSYELDDEGYVTKMTKRCTYSDSLGDYIETYTFTYY